MGWEFGSKGKKAGSLRQEPSTSAPAILEYYGQAWGKYNVYRHGHQRIYDPSRAWEIDSDHFHPIDATWMIVIRVSGATSGKPSRTFPGFGFPRDDLPPIMNRTILGNAIMNPSSTEPSGPPEGSPYRW